MTKIGRWITGLLLMGTATLPASAATLYGATGKGGATAPRTLYILNKSNAAATFVLCLGDANLDGEAIAYSPIDKLMYHWAGNHTNVMESVNLATKAVTNIRQSGDSHKEIAGATWHTATNRFLVIASTNHLFAATPGGAISLIGRVSDVDVINALALVGGNLYGVSQDHPEFYALDPATSALLATKTVTGLPELSGFNGLATDPDTGMLWAIARVGGGPGARYLGTLNPHTAVFTSVGLLSDAVATLAFGGTSGPKTLDRPFKVSYASNANEGDSVINIPDTGANGPFATR